MSNPFDAFREVIEHEANQDDDGGFFARLGGLEPDPEDDGPTARGLFQHWDTERDGPAVKWPPRDNGGTGWNINKGRSSGPHLQWVKNTTGNIENIITREEWDKANPPIWPSTGGILPRAKTQLRKRQPIVKVRRKWAWIIFRTWAWECQICYQNRLASTWEKAIGQANRHAHSHHGKDQK